MAQLIGRTLQGDGIPLGTTVSSYLTEAQFQAANGTGWVLDDGRSIAGSALATLTGITSLADLRGVTVRGKNNGRSDGFQNPDGEVAIGTFQDHSFNSHDHGSNTGTISADHTHSHTTAEFVGNSGIPAGGSTNRIWNSNQAGQTARTNVSSGASSNHTHPISAAGGNETRMRNVTLNKFVKINY